MAGHSKWANIRFRKGKQDAARNKVFTKLARLITVAAKQGSDPLTNASLRLAMDKAQRMNMGKDIVQRAISKGDKSQGAEDLVAVRYEGYGPGGIACWVHGLTDNRNRTVAEVRHAFSKLGGSMGAEGTVSYLFQHRGLILCSHEEEERLIELVIESGALDVKPLENNMYEVLTEPNDFEKIKNNLQADNIRIEEAELTYLPDNEVACEKDQALKVMKLIDMLEGLDDVQSVYTNAGFPEGFDPDE
ncbi:MAG TPA: YebC/PmpR family DNA-binding transcriptional regulator [Gammaproteobacteria bacterium]|nr:YebC/PmpR family DNA-binding transcriptional regulator [Gammaproteobacteria bacterium]